MKKFFLIVFFCVFATCTCTLSAQESAYILQPEDVVNITVYEHPDLETKARITSTGEIAFPLIGKINVSGFTVSELEAELAKLLEADYLIDPQVQIFIDDYHSKQISVLGSVNKPGKYDMYTERQTTVLEAIAMAEGFNDVASINGTKIIRNEDGKETTIKVKVTDITKKGEKEKDISLKPGDIVFVPESFF